MVYLFYGFGDGGVDGCCIVYVCVDGDGFVFSGVYFCGYGFCFFFWVVVVNYYVGIMCCECVCGGCVDIGVCIVDEDDFIC